MRMMIIDEMKRTAFLHQIVELSGALWCNARGVSSASQLTAIKTLRDRSGAPLGDVKKALEEANYNIDHAYDALRLKGLAAAAKKASRIATDGLVGVATNANRAAVIEVNCETDFVARNKVFWKFVHEASNALLNNNSHINEDWTELKAEDYLKVTLPSTGRTLEEMVGELSGTIREKINIRRIYSFTTTGQFFTYCHNPPPSAVPGLGKIGCVVSLEAKDKSPLSTNTLDSLKETQFGSQLAMHVAGMKPLFLDKETVDEDRLEHEMALLKQQALASGKPEAIVDKIVKGRMHKFYEEFCLMQQPFLMNEEKTVAQQVNAFLKDNKIIDSVTISAFLRVQCGQGMNNHLSNDQ